MCLNDLLTVNIFISLVIFPADDVVQPVLLQVITVERTPSDCEAH